MSNSYQQQVFTDYVLKRDKQTLSLNLMKPTRSGLREECLHVYTEKGSPKNDRVLRLFFGPIDAGNDYVQRIRNFDVDKFRPLVKFLKGATTDTHDKNIELLAWLIDFQAQGSQKNDTNEVSVGTSVVPDQQTPIGNFNTVLGTQSFNKLISTPTLNKVFALSGSLVFTRKFNLVILTFIVAVFLLTGWSVFSTKRNQCMYWTGSQYKSIPCHEKSGDAAIIALDTFKVTHFKRITRPDTITRYSLGKVWYKKITRDSVEFYTAAGEYPLDHTKRLKPMTDYMLEKYILH